MDRAEIDRLEKVTRRDATALQAIKLQLLGELARSPSKEIRWHVAQLLPRLELHDAAHRRRRLAILRRWIDEDTSAIVRVNALQALADLARDEPSLRNEVERRVCVGLSDQSAALRARARKLLGVDWSLAVDRNL
jgi:hypothetical protein